MEKLKNKDVPVQSVKKALDLLSVLVFEDPARQGMVLKQLAQRMGQPANSTHNLLKTMVACGYVAQNGGGKYVAGPVCQQIGKLNQICSAQVTQAVLEACQSVNEAVDESVVFTTFTGGRRIRMAFVDASHVIKVDHAVFDTWSIFASPTGRVMLAYASDLEVQAAIDRYGWPAGNWQGIEDKDALQTALQEVRQAGYSLVDDRPDLFAIACPVLDEAGELLGAIGSYGPVFRCGPEKQKEILSQLQQAAQLLQKKI